MLGLLSRLTWIALIALLVAPAVWAQRDVEELRARFQRETKPVDKARAFPKLGEAQLVRVRDLASKEKYEEALETFEQYRDDAVLAGNGLKSSGINAEKKSNGFKHLQIHLRRSGRFIEDTIASLPFDRREPFEAIRKELEKLDQELIDMLFPRQPGRKPDAKTQKKG